MRLRTLESFWLVNNGLMYSYPSLEKNLESDYIVLGGGITGALISHALIEAGHQVTLLDKRDIGQGSTAATTALLQYEIDVPLYHLAKLIGEEPAVYCYRAGLKALNGLKQLIITEQIDCDYQPKKSLYFAHNRRAAETLGKEFDIRNQYQMGVNWLSKETILDEFGLITHGGILSSQAASMDAYRFTQNLIQKNIQKGMTVYDQTDIKKIDHGEKEVVLHLENGFKARCQKILMCTGFETTEYLPEKTADLLSTFACISECGIKTTPGWDDLLVWNTEEPYLYMRKTPDGRLLIGGADSPFNSGSFRERVKEKKTQLLMQQLKKRMPSLHFIEDFSWAGVFGTTKDGLPYIGEHPKFPNTFFVLGFGGNGITFSIQAMDLATKWLQKETDPLLDYYRFGR